jgi:hypothetical protein
MLRNHGVLTLGDTVCRIHLSISYSFGHVVSPFQNPVQIAECFTKLYFCVMACQMQVNATAAMNQGTEGKRACAAGLVMSGCLPTCLHVLSSKHKGRDQPERRCDSSSRCFSENSHADGTEL